MGLPPPPTPPPTTTTTPTTAAGMAAVAEAAAERRVGEGKGGNNGQEKEFDVLKGGADKGEEELLWLVWPFQVRAWMWKRGGVGWGRRAERGVGGGVGGGKSRFQVLNLESGI